MKKVFEECKNVGDEVMIFLRCGWEDSVSFVNRLIWLIDSKIIVIF